LSKVDFHRDRRSFQHSVSTTARVAGKLQGIADREKISISRAINLILENYFK